MSEDEAIEALAAGCIQIAIRERHAYYRHVVEDAAQVLRTNPALLLALLPGVGEALEQYRQASAEVRILLDRWRTSRGGPPRGEVDRLLERARLLKEQRNRTLWDALDAAIPPEPHST